MKSVVLGAAALTAVEQHHRFVGTESRIGDLDAFTCDSRRLGKVPCGVKSERLSIG